VAIRDVEYDGPVYDLDIANLHNCAVNGVLVHNSIYSWRSADYRNIINFQTDFPDAQVVMLEQNYRSTQTILDSAQQVIRRNQTRHEKTL
jgi:DNA helicase-2/ATP-dependent DNA helicase PcrA